MSAGRSEQPGGPLAARAGVVAALSLVVAVVLGDSGVVTLALPEILRDFGAEVGEVAWVLIAFNLVLALVAVPAARVCVRGDPAAATAGGLIGFAAATTVCAVAPSLGVLIAARAIQAAGGALVIVGSLELLVEATGAERAGVRRWAAAGVAGAALGPVIGGLLTSAFSWRAIFVVQIPVVLLALPAAIALRGRVRAASRRTWTPRRTARMCWPTWRWRCCRRRSRRRCSCWCCCSWTAGAHSPAVAAVAVTAVPVAALAAGPVFRGVRAGTRSEAVAGSVLIAGGLAGLALLPGAELAWTLAPQVLVGLGLGLSVDSLTAAALRDRIPRALHGGWTIAARHAGVVVGLAILTPIFTADLRHAETPAKEAIASLVLDAPLPASTKLDLAEQLGRRLIAERGRVPDLRPAFRTLRRAGDAGAHRRGPGARPRGSAQARRDPRVPHRFPRRGGAGAAGARARAGPERSEPLMRATRAAAHRRAARRRPSSASRSPRAAATTCRAGRPIRAPTRADPAHPAAARTARRTDRPARPRQRRVPARHLPRAPRPRPRGHPLAGSPRRPPRSRRACATQSTGSTARAACPRSPSFFPKRSTRPICPGSPRRSSRRSRTDRSTTRSRPDRCCAAPIDELDVARLLRELHDPRQLDSAVRSAILQAALRQILDRLRP